MKYFIFSALIAFCQLILLAMLAKCISHHKKPPLLVLVALKIFIYLILIFLLVDKYIKYIVQCLCGYLVGLTGGAVILYILWCFVLPTLWVKLEKIPFFAALFENVGRRLGLKKQRGFTVKRVKF